MASSKHWRLACNACPSSRVLQHLEIVGNGNCSRPPASSPCREERKRSPANSNIHCKHSNNLLDKPFMFHGDVKYGRKRFQKSGPCLSKAALSAAAAVPASLSSHKISSSGQFLTKEQIEKLCPSNFLKPDPKTLEKGRQIAPPAGSNFTVGFQITDGVSGEEKHYELEVSDYSHGIDRIVTNLAFANFDSNELNWNEGSKNDNINSIRCYDYLFGRTNADDSELQYVGYVDVARNGSAVYVFHGSDNRLHYTSYFNNEFKTPEEDKIGVNRIVHKAQDHLAHFTLRVKSPGRGLKYVHSTYQKTFLEELARKCASFSEISERPSKTDTAVKVTSGDVLFEFSSIENSHDLHFWNLACNCKFQELLWLDQDQVMRIWLGQGLRGLRIPSDLNKYFKESELPNLEYITYNINIKKSKNQNFECYYFFGKQDSTIYCLVLNENHDTIIVDRAEWSVFQAIIQDLTAEG